MIESFKELFEESASQQADMRVGSLLVGSIISITREKAIVDVGLKSEGIISMDEFRSPQGDIEIEQGDTVEVLLKSIDDGNGTITLSHLEANQKIQWKSLKESMDLKVPIKGVVDSAVNAGLMVNIGAVKAFLPGSLVDVYQVKDLSSLIGQEIEAQVINMDENRSSVVISRKAVLQEDDSANRELLLKTIEQGQELEGIVKTLTNYGAFIDVGGVDGLLHITDISWERINHPSEKIEAGDKINVKVLNYDKEKQRISLGLKQLTASPWDNITDRFPIGKKVSGTVSNITDYGAFVSIDEGVEGLVHVSEMGWSKTNHHPSKVIKLDQEVDVVILDIQKAKHRISLSMKQALESPWEVFEVKQAKGDRLVVEVKTITDFGLFVGLPGGIDGLIRLDDVSKDRLSPEDLVANYSKGQELEVVVLNIDAKKQKVSLGIKQLQSEKTRNIVAENNKTEEPKNNSFATLLKDIK